MKTKEKQGITLIALVITIIVLLILAGVSIAVLTGDNGTITKAVESKFKTELAEAQEEFELYVTRKYAEDSKFEEGTLNAGKTFLSYNTIPEGETGNIYDVLKNTPKKYAQCFEVIKGELIYANTNKQQLEWALEIGMKINPYLIVDGELLSAETNLMLMDEATGTVVVPESVTKIGEGAFANVEGIRRIIIPSHVKEIAPNAFSYNTTIEEVVMEEGVEKIGTRAFIGCSALKKMDIPDSVTTIGDQALMHCTNIEDIHISKNVKQIPYGFIQGNQKLGTIEIPEGVESLGPSAFYSTKITTIILPSTLKEMEGTTFANTPNLTQIEINPNNKYLKYENGIILTYNGTNIKYIRQNLKTIIIPEGVTNYSGEMLVGSNATTIEIPNSLKITGGTFFNGAYSLANIKIKEDNPYCKLIDNNLYDKAGETLIRYVGNDKTEFTIPEGVKKLTLRCIISSKLKQLNLPTTLETIEGWSLESCTGIEMLEIPKNVKGFDGSAIPINSKIRVVKENQNLQSINDEMVLSKDGKVLYVASRTVGQFTIPNTVETIGHNAFYSNNKTQEIIFPEGVKTIGNSAFRDNVNLKKVVIPSTIISIGTSAFDRCQNLREVLIAKPEGSISGSPWGCPYGARGIKWNTTNT